MSRLTLVLAATVHPGDVSDHVTLVDSVMQAGPQPASGRQPEEEYAEVAADKGYHSGATLELCDGVGRANLHPEPKNKGCRRWTDKSKRNVQPCWRTGDG